MGSRGREGTRAIKSLGTHQVHGTLAIMGSMGAVVCLRLVSPASVSKETFQEGKISNTHTEGVHIALSSWSLSYPSYRSRKLTMSGFMTRVPSTKRDYLILWLQDGASREEGGSWKRTFR